MTINNNNNNNNQSNIVTYRNKLPVNALDVKELSSFPFISPREIVTRIHRASQKYFFFVINKTLSN